MDMAQDRKGHARKGQEDEGMAKPRHLFLLNPYEEHALTKCPRCGSETKVRKHCLAVYLEPNNLFVLNKTCRYCPGCDLIIARKAELDQLLRVACEKHCPGAVGNDYQVVGTMNRQDWRGAMNGSIAVSKAIEGVQPFKDLVDFVLKPGGLRYCPELAKRGS